MFFGVAYGSIERKKKRKRKSVISSNIFGNASDDEDESKEAKVFQGFGSWLGTRRSEGESSCVNAGLVPVSRPESPVADENRDSSHKRAKFYDECVENGEGNDAC
ncbi:hypothetical protein P8452_29871 [Trifolium repens]|nr:hypothetical protein P8452_29871 [Trifolium repens]